MGLPEIEDYMAQKEDKNQTNIESSESMNMNQKK